MGLSVDTKETFDFVLELDKEKPEAIRPSFQFRYPSYRQLKQIDKVLIEARHAKSTEEFERGYDALRILLAGWKNMSIEYDPARIDEVVTTLDFFELYERLLHEANESEIDKKKRRLQSRSNTGQSVSEIAAQPVVETAQPIK